MHLILLKSAISRQAKANKFSLVFWLNEIVHINAPLAAARHSPIKQVCRSLLSPCTNVRFLLLP